MLRIGFLPSDFNPMLLMLGESEEFRALGGVLRQFARHQADVRLDALSFCAPAGLKLTLTAGSPEGVFPSVDRSDRHSIWRIEPERAVEFADKIDQLAESGRISGSELLECGTGEQIPVKLSRGEYTDDFLLPAA